MKKYYKALPLALMFLAFPAMAEVELKDASEILGKWRLHDESIKLNADKRPVQVEWNVKSDGTVETVTSDSTVKASERRIGEIRLPMKYSIENGGIKKQVVPGREQYEFCKVIEKTDTDMILKCTYFYYLTKIK
jgi:hypothetical protein